MVSVISTDDSLVEFSSDSPSILAIIASVSSVGSTSSPMSRAIVVETRNEVECFELAVSLGLFGVLIIGLDVVLAAVSELDDETELETLESSSLSLDRVEDERILSVVRFWESVFSCDVVSAVVVEKNGRFVEIALLVDEVSLDGVSLATAVCVDNLFSCGRSVVPALLVDEVS